MPFVIQSTSTWINKKTGKEVSTVGYFKYHNNVIFPYNSMEGDWQKAKQYDTSTEAHREKRKYFSGREKVKVINSEKLQINIPS